MLNKVKYRFMSYEKMGVRIEEIRKVLEGRVCYKKRKKLWNELTIIVKTLIWRNRRNKEFMECAKGMLDELVAAEELRGKS